MCKSDVLPYYHITFLPYLSNVFSSAICWYKNSSKMPNKPMTACLWHGQCHSYLRFIEEKDINYEISNNSIVIFMQMHVVACVLCCFDAYYVVGWDTLLYPPKNPRLARNTVCNCQHFELVQKPAQAGGLSRSGANLYGFLLLVVVLAVFWY